MFAPLVYFKLFIHYLTERGLKIHSEKQKAPKSNALKT